MSGGLDSSMTAVILRRQGYDVVGITMKTWEYELSGNRRKETGCCSLDSIHDARSVAVKYDFPHHVIDIRREFGESVIDYFQQEYLRARTPNPCVMCNTYIKWDALLERADQLECPLIATGHYARLNNIGGRHVLSKAVDKSKDQSYALWGVGQKSLSRTLFPLGNLLKSEVRKMAAEEGLEAIAAKKESYEICFIPDNDFRGFLRRRMSSEGKEIPKGDFVLKDGTRVGTHEGYPYYTIGQRKGLGIALGYPVYVLEIRKETNQVVLGNVEDLKGSEMMVENLNIQKYDSLPDGSLTVLTKIRYNDKGEMSTIIREGTGARVRFHDQVSAITPGQAAVFYEGDEVLGGGWIRSAL